MNMKLSILIVTYNQEKYITEAIEGVLMQDTVFDFEIVIADDKSTDNTVHIIKERLKGKPNFRILDTKENLGMVKNYRRGFDQCKGEYIATLEGDDYWTDPNRLTKMIHFLDNHRECSMCFNRCIVLNDKTKDFIPQGWESNENYQYFTTRNLAVKNKVGNLSKCIFRKSVIDKLPNNLYDFWIADWMLAMAVGQFGLLASLKDIMSVYRVNEMGQWSSKNATQKSKLLLSNIENYNKFFDYKYDNEFKSNKKRILDSQKKFSRSKIKAFIPPFIIKVMKWIVPPKLMS